MRNSIVTATALVLSAAFAIPAIAQSNPQNNMGLAPYQQVAPLAPPPQPTPSPLPPGSYRSPGVQVQPQTDSYGDRTTRCLHYGATQGLTGGDLSAYSRSCANN
jgi:hypothetical protein